MCGEFVGSDLRRGILPDHSPRLEVRSSCESPSVDLSDGGANATIIDHVAPGSFGRPAASIADMAVEVELAKTVARRAKDVGR